MELGNRRLVTIVLVVGGALLLLCAVVAIVLRCGRPRSAPAAEPSPTITATVAVAATTPTATAALNPTAAAAATRVLTPTAIPTAGPASTRITAPVQIVIPTLGIDVRVVEVGWHLSEVDGEPRGVWETVAGAAGHHRGTADPGERGNCVISGHSSDEGGGVFSRLEELVAGARVRVTTVGGQRHDYVVTEVLKLDETGATTEEKHEHARLLDPTDEPTLTLVTCWPAWSYTHRIVVRARLLAP